MILIRLLMVLVGYLFGMFQTGYFYGKLINVDLTKKGSGNTGATNALRVLGVRSGLIVFFFDALKAFIPVFTVRMIFKDTPYEYVMAAYCVLGVILGNDYPFYLKFNGGKGVAATAGWVLAMDWRIFLIGISIFFIIAFATRYVSVASLCIAVLTVILFALFILTGWIDIAPPGRYEVLAIVLICAVLMFVRHRGNIRRLIHHEELRFGSKKEKN